MDDDQNRARAKRLFMAHIARTARPFPPEINAADLVAKWKDVTFTANLTLKGNLDLKLGDVKLAATGEVSDGQAPAADAATVVLPAEVMVGVSLVEAGTKTGEGQLILAVSPAWHRIFDELSADPGALCRLLDPRQFEEFVAGAYREDGWDVTLTPRSGDGGVDIIASRKDVGAIRVLDQVKLYDPSRLVPADDVRALWAVLDRDRKASKAVLTTTSGFAPGVYKEFGDSIPTRLDLRDGKALSDWLKRIAAKSDVSN